MIQVARGNLGPRAVPDRSGALAQAQEVLGAPGLLPRGGGPRTGPDHHGGQRAQVIKRVPKQGRRAAVRHRGHRSRRTDRSRGSLGASPGASTAVPIMLDVIERCFLDQLESWKPRLQEIVPSYGKKLGEQASLAEPYAAIHAEGARAHRYDRRAPDRRWRRARGVRSRRSGRAALPDQWRHDLGDRG